MHVAITKGNNFIKPPIIKLNFKACCYMLWINLKQSVLKVLKAWSLFLKQIKLLYHSVGGYLHI